MPRKPAVPKRPATVVEALTRELGGFPAHLRDSAVAASALALAASVDDPRTSATARSMCARELREHVEALRALVPPKPVEKDAVADIAARRAARRQSAS